MTLRAHLSLIALLLLMGACASTSPDKTSGATPLVWPAPPDAPRIAFDHAFSKPEDLGIGLGFFRRLGNWIFGEDANEMVRPMAMLERDKVLYVADPGVKGVHRYDPSADRHEVIRADNQQPIVSPVGLTQDAAGVVYVTDSARGAVYTISPNAKLAVRLALEPAPKQPTGIAFDDKRKRLYVADTAQHCINVYDAQGQLISRLGKRGKGPLEFNFPTLLWLDADGRLLVTDSLNFRTQLLSPDGSHLASFGRPGDHPGDSPRQKGIATDQHGHIYMVDSLLHAVQIFDDKGQFLLSFGAQGISPGEFWLPTGIFINKDNLIYVADSYNRRVQVFRYVGGTS